MAFGKSFITNPDRPLRLQANTALNDYDHATFMAAGYTDYPALEAF